MTDSHQRSEGFTLIEVLVTIVVISLGVVGLVGGLLTAASGSSVTTKGSDDRAIVQATAEQLENATYTTSPTSSCGTPDYSAAVAGIQLPANSNGTNKAVAAQIVSISFWNGSDFSSDCSYDRSPGSVDERMQLITIKSGAERLTIVKRAT